MIYIIIYSRSYALGLLTKNSGSSYIFCLRHSSFCARSSSIPVSTDVIVAVGEGSVSGGGIVRNVEGFFVERMRFKVFLKKRFSSIIDESSALRLPMGAKYLFKVVTGEMPKRVVGMTLGANAVAPYKRKDRLRAVEENFMFGFIVKSEL